MYYIYHICIICMYIYKSLYINFVYIYIYIYMYFICSHLTICIEIKSWAAKKSAPKF